MTLTFEDDGEAFLSVLALVIGADMIGNLSEREFLLEQLVGIDRFRDLTPDELGTRLATVTDKVHGSLPQQDGALTSEGIASLLVEVERTLDPDLARTLVQTTEKLCADGICAPEEDLLAQIRQTLG
jgi:hypothetical protein